MEMDAFYIVKELNDLNKLGVIFWYNFGCNYLGITFHTEIDMYLYLHYDLHTRLKAYQVKTEYPKFIQYRW